MKIIIITIFVGVVILYSILQSIYKEFKAKKLTTKFAKCVSKRFKAIIEKALLLKIQEKSGKCWKGTQAGKIDCKTCTKRGICEKEICFSIASNIIATMKETNYEAEAFAWNFAIAIEQELFNEKLTLQNSDKTFQNVK